MHLAARMVLWRAFPLFQLPHWGQGSLHYGNQPQAAKTSIFSFFRRFRAPGLIPRPSPGLDIKFPVPNQFFGCIFAELYHFLSFLSGWESCEPLFDELGFLFHDFVRVAAATNPHRPISGPCSIEKYPSSRMANRYTRIFDAG